MTGEVTLLDTEFTSWEGAMARNWSGPDEYRELVQIGAIRLKPGTLEETAELSLIVKPVRNPVLSDYFVNLTGITNERLKSEGIGFAEAVERFRDFTQGGLIYSYGGDCEIINENITLHDCVNTVQEFEDSNLHEWFAEQGVDTQSVCSGELARSVGSDWEPPAHDALNDVRSIAEAMRVLEKTGAKPPF